MTHYYFHKGPGVPRWRQITAWILQMIAAIVFLTAGSAKLIGTEKAIAVFEDLGSGPGLRYLIGGLEIIGAMLLISAERAIIGGVLLAVLMGSASLLHLVLLPGSPIPALFLFSITGVIMWLKIPPESES